MKLLNTALLMAITLSALVSAPIRAHADERLFVYSYEAEVLPKGKFEFEQWITSRIGKTGGDFARWDLREELEYGITDKLTTALYINMTQTYQDPDEGPARNHFKFKGFSTEWKYQILNPHLDAFGLVAYLEGTLSGSEAEVEEKIILQKNFGNWVTAINATLEQEWEFEDGETEREAKLEFSGGISYHLSPHWAVGIEARNHQVFEPGFSLHRQENNAWFLGPNVHYGASDWWVTFAVLPQIGKQELDDHERVEARLIFGYLF